MSLSVTKQNVTQKIVNQIHTKFILYEAYIEPALKESYKQTPKRLTVEILERHIKYVFDPVNKYREIERSLADSTLYMIKTMHSLTIEEQETKIWELIVDPLKPNQQQLKLLRELFSDFSINNNLIRFMKTQKIME